MCSLHLIELPTHDYKVTYAHAQLLFDTENKGLMHTHAVNSKLFTLYRPKIKKQRDEDWGEHPVQQRFELCKIYKARREEVQWG